MPHPALNTMLFIHPSLGPFHIPRLRALAEYGAGQGFAVHNIELSGHLKAYPWIVTGQWQRFDNMVLFPEANLEDIPGRALWAALRGGLERLRPDVVFLYGYSYAAMRKARSWARQNQVATVLVSDSNAFDKKRYKPFELFKSSLVPCYDAAFVGGSSSTRYLQALGMPPERITSGYDVIDNALFSRRAQSNREDSAGIRQRWHLPQEYFLFVGRLIPEKNLPRLLSAYRQYVAALAEGYTPWDLVLCGSGPEEEEIAGLIQALPAPVRAKIHRYGFIQQPDIIDFYSCAAGFVLPSLSESWGLVVNEALACQVPAIVSNRAGCAQDLIAPDVNGWLIDPLAVDDLTRCLLKMTRMDAAARRAMGARGGEIVAAWGLERFSQGAVESARIAIGQQKKPWKGLSPTLFSMLHTALDRPGG